MERLPVYSMGHYDVLVLIVNNNNPSCLPGLNQYNAKDHAHCDFKYAMHTQRANKA